jgi:hypothetical protein
VGIVDGLNLYVFVGSNPISLYDQNGEKTCYVTIYRGHAWQFDGVTPNPDGTWWDSITPEILNNYYRAWGAHSTVCNRFGFVACNANSLNFKLDSRIRIKNFPVIIFKTGKGSYEPQVTWAAGKAQLMQAVNLCRDKSCCCDKVVLRWRCVHKDSRSHMKRMKLLRWCYQSRVFSCKK